MADEHLRNLPVPFYSQRKNEYIWYERYKSIDSEVIASPKLINYRIINRITH